MDVGYTLFFSLADFRPRLIFSLSVHIPDTLLDVALFFFAQQINTGVVQRVCAQRGAAFEYVVTLMQDELDGPHKDTKNRQYPAGFKIDICLSALGVADDAVAAVVDDDARIDDDDASAAAAEAEEEPENDDD